MYVKFIFLSHRCCYFNPEEGVSGQEACILLGFFSAQMSWLNKKQCPVLAHISHCHPIPIPAWELSCGPGNLQSAVNQNFRSSSGCRLWLACSHLFMDAPQGTPVLGTRGFMKGRAAEAIPLLLRSLHYTAQGCFRKASLAHPATGHCDGSQALHQRPTLPTSPNLTNAGS